MDNLRIILYVALALVGVQIYSAWQEEQKAPTVDTVTQQAEDIPAAAVVENDSPTAEQVIETSPVTEAVKQAEETQAEAKIVRVKTDVLDILIDTRGGAIIQTNLLDYPLELGSQQTVRLQNSAEDSFYNVQYGLSSNTSDVPSQATVFASEKSDYILQDGQNEITVPLVWQKGGVTFTKTYTFKRNAYLVQQKTEVKNNSSQNWTGNQYRQIIRTDKDDSQPFIYTYTGAVIYNKEDKYEKIDYEDMEDEDLDSRFDHGWGAMIQHYFMTALIPAANESNRYETQVKNVNGINHYILRLKTVGKRVAPQESAVFSSELYIGPKILDRLEAIAPGLELAVDFGLLTIISKPMFIALNWIEGIVKNWGWAIIILTVGLKILFFPLANTSYKSMAKMKKVMPEVQKLKERYGDDRQKIAKEQMKLFQKHKVNPAAGCFPMLIQMPVFMGLYWALLESVELRQAPFILWIHDLSIADPYFILPVIMGASMFIQQKLNPPPADPMQAKMMQMMPVMFSVFFFFLPVGLVLYSVTNNVLSIIQQYVITKRIEAEG